jgi:hypothetical protein
VRVHFCTGRYGKQRTTSICSEGKQYICGLYSEANVYVIEATNISSHLSFWMKGFQCPPLPKKPAFHIVIFPRDIRAYDSEVFDSDIFTKSVKVALMKRP